MFYFKKYSNLIIMKSSFFSKTPFFVGDISANHCGSLNHAKKLIIQAKKNGIDAVKLQTYKPESLTLKSKKSFFKISKGLWKGQNLWELYEKAQTPYEWHKKLFSFSKKIGIKIFSTPFDEEAVDFLESLKCPAYKIASLEMHHKNLIRKVVNTGKPIIISTGTFDLEEITKIFEFVKRLKAADITLLYCVSNYPSNLKDFNLNNIKILKNRFGCRIGLSDHSLNNLVSSMAVAAGAEVIEKHIALHNQIKGPDIAFSLKGKEIKKLREDVDLAYSLLGKPYFFRSDVEKKNIINRRSIFVSEKIKKGEKFTKKNIKVIRPGHGLSPLYYNKILNKKCPKNFNEGTPLKKEILKLLKIN